MKAPDLPQDLQYLLKGKPYTTDKIGQSGSSIFLYADAVLKIRPETEETRSEHVMLTWLDDKLPIPHCMYHAAECGTDYLLMSRVQGKMACDKTYMSDPVALTDALATALQLLWQVNTADCPVSWALDRKLAAARQRVERGEIDIKNTEPDTFSDNGFRDPMHLLTWLEENQPPEDLVLSHGDFCLPNIFLTDGEPSGFIDLGRAGLADPWQDIALCYRSLVHNYSGKYAKGPVPATFDPERLFTALHIEPDWKKLRYYILLDELF